MRRQLDQGGRTFTLGDGGEAISFDWSTNEFFFTVGKLIDKGARLINAELADVRFEKAGPQPGPTLHGHATTHLLLETGFIARGKFLFKRFEYRADIKDDVWNLRAGTARS